MEEKKDFEKMLQEAIRKEKDNENRNSNTTHSREREKYGDIIFKNLQN